MLISEFSKANLFNIVTNLKKDNKLIDIKVMLMICRSIVSGLAILHEQNIMHHNIKLTNILTFQYEISAKAFKLADYGALG